jgi:hypothetical protein
MMQRIGLALLRFCLCTWVGVAIFFYVAVLSVVESMVYDTPPLSRFSRPTYFLPYYFGFAFPLLGVAFLCAFGALWNARLGLFRRSTTLLLVALALGMVAADYTMVYRILVAMLSGPGANQLVASKVLALYDFNLLLKATVMGISVVAASFAVWPEISGDLPARRPDPAL